MGEGARDLPVDRGNPRILLARLVDLAKRMRQRLADRCEAEGVSASRFAILQALADADEGSCSQTELAAELGLSESNVCSLVERMRESGLLFRFRSKTDRRKSVLMLTARGRELAEAIDRTQNLEAASLLAVLDADQQSDLRILLEQLHAHLEASPQILVSLDEVATRDCWDTSPTNEPAEAAPGAERTTRRAS